MDEPQEPLQRSTRPTQLTSISKSIVFLLIAASFITGFMAGELLEETGEVKNTADSVNSKTTNKLKDAFEKGGEGFQDFGPNNPEQDKSTDVTGQITEKENPTLIDWKSWHGLLSPAMAILFGWILFQHARAGWRIRANLWTGLPLIVIFGGLIITGTLILYPLKVMSLESWEQPENWLRELHDLFGWLFLACFLGHLLGAKIFRKKFKKPVDTETLSQ